MVKCGAEPGCRAGRRCSNHKLRYFVRVNSNSAAPSAPAPAGQVAQQIRAALPPGGLFAGMNWKTSNAPFPLGPELAKDIESLGRVLLQFYRAVNLLYRKSGEGKQPEWIAQWLDLDMLYKFTDVKIEDSSVPPPESQSREKWLLDRSRLSNLVANALTIYERRGTPEGILLALRLSTGYGDFVVEDATSAGPSALDPFHFKVYVNPAVSSLSLLVERIVTLFKPAHSTFELTYRSRTSVGEKS